MSRIKLPQQPTAALVAHQDRYIAALHAMQSGVAFLMGNGDNETSPKHLRVGINSALSSHGALVQLLIDKGIFTLEEYMGYQADFAENEAENYQQAVEAITGAKVTLR